jgi:REP element-mobilizing transposase RayT
MSRATRVEYPGALYHAMGRGIDGREVFPEDEHRERFLRLVGKAVESGDLVVHAYCLMTTHYHLLLETPRGGLSRWMQRLLGEYAQGYNIRMERFGHLWQGRYKAILVEPGGYFLECSRYIHLNPARAGLSRPAEGWKWSSYRNYVKGLGRPAVPWVATKMILAEMGGSGVSEKEARRAYREYVESAKDQAPISPWERAKAGLVLGSESFVAWVKEQVKARPLTGEEPSLRRLRREGPAPAEKVEEQVRKEFGDPRVPGQARQILAALLVEQSGMRPSEVARRLGVSPAAITKSVARVAKGGGLSAETVLRVQRIGWRWEKENKNRV